MKYFKRKLENFDAAKQDVLNQSQVQRWKRVLQRFFTCRFGDMSGTMTYYTLLSFFPFIILLVSILASFSQRFMMTQGMDITEFIQKNLMVPSVIGDSIGVIIEQVITANKLPLISISALVTWWSASRGFDTYISVLQATYEVKPTPWVKRKFFGLLFVILFSLAIVVMLLGVSFGKAIIEQLYNLLGFEFLLSVWTDAFRYIIPIFYIGFLFFISYHFFSKRRGPNWLSFVCSLIPTLGWVVLSIGIPWFAEKSTRYHLVYGSLAGIVIFMLWLYLIFYVIFVGAYVHSELIKYIKNRDIIKRAKNIKAISKRQ